MRLVLAAVRDRELPRARGKQGNNATASGAWRGAWERPVSAGVGTSREGTAASENRGVRREDLRMEPEADTRPDDLALPLPARSLPLHRTTTSITLPAVASMPPVRRVPPTTNLALIPIVGPAPHSLSFSHGGRLKMNSALVLARRKAASFFLLNSNGRDYIALYSCSA
ncbi:hypothetical protein GUJ93_ZPchr0008g13055 [Zizania palustris]|uniref:Uncharacterized protein n=1 Tax=Zizania palustris TaxID=103762 RepID=A0A8J5UX45_ZIZPA|nr:hypothetical protein GUJ93_ZPchr0008g13055 [Zizania palustris]